MLSIRGSIYAALQLGAYARKAYCEGIRVIVDSSPGAGGVNMQFVWFIVIGLVAGWLAGTLVKGGGFGLVGDIVVGVVGALLGGFLFSALGVSSGGSLLGAIIVATVGAIVLIFILRL